MYQSQGFFTPLVHILICSHACFCLLKVYVAEEPMGGMHCGQAGEPPQAAIHQHSGQLCNNYTMIIQNAPS